MKIRVISEPVQSQINTTLKPLEREDSNAELEKGEIVFNPEKGTLHSVLGNKHSNGGTPVNLQEGSFIFSDFKKLAFNKPDLNELELKDGPKGKINNTPAKVLKREINLKNHNGYIDLLNKEVVDEISGNSAQLMLMKNLEKLGQIAYKQEEKKNFPENIPDISRNTAPIYDQELDTEITRADQYKLGGKVLPKYQDAGGFMDYFRKNPQFRFKKVDPSQPYRTTPLGYQNPEYLTNISNWLNSIYDYGPQVNSIQDPIKRMGAIRQAQTKNFPGLVGAARDQGFFNDNATDDKKYVDINRVYYDAFGVNTPKNFRTQEEKDKFIREEGWNTLDPKYGQPNYYSRFNPITGRGEFIQANHRTNVPLYRPEKIETNPERKPLDQLFTREETPENTEELPLIANYPKLGLTDYQKLRLGQQGLRALSIKRYDPIRQQQESVFTQPELLNVQPYLNQINQSYFNANQNLQTLTNPSQLIAANSQLSGSRLDSLNKSIGEIQNNNVNLQNQSKQQIANLLNTDAQQNRAFDKQYMDDSIRSRVNYDNLKDIATNKFYENLDTNLFDLQTAQNIINSQRLIPTDKIVRGPDGKLARLAELPILPDKGFLGYGVKPNMNISERGYLNYQAGPQDQVVSQARERMTQVMNELASIDMSDPKMGILYNAKVRELERLSKILENSPLNNRGAKQ